MGGMATVFLARQTGPAGYAREVALKLLHPYLRSDPEAVASFIREARVTAELRHANIVQLLDVDDPPEGVFMVMEYVEGGSLATLARDPNLPRPIGLRVVADALAGLHHAHQYRDATGRELHLVHRDFTPQNILVGTDGIAKLADFGIVKLLDAQQRTTTGTVKGKTSYMAPEQAQGLAIDARTDIWAAGVVVWELLARRRLFEDRSQAAILLRIVRDRPPRLRTIDAGVSAELDDLVARALEPDPSKRYPSAQAFREALLAAGGEIAEVDEVAGFVQRAFEVSVSEKRRALTHLAPTRSDSGVLEPRRQSGILSLTQRMEPAPAAMPSAAIRRRKRWRSIVALAAALGLVSVVATAAALSRRRPAPAPSVSAPAASPPPMDLPPNESSVAVDLAAPAASSVRRAVPRHPAGRTKVPAPQAAGSSAPMATGSSELPKLLGSPYQGGPSGRGAD
jgi:serine/threonine-protein kinase